MNIALVSRMVSDLESLLYEKDYFIQSYFVLKTKITKKLKNEEWNGVRSFGNLLQFIFSTQIITLKLNSSSYIVKRNAKTTRFNSSLIIKMRYKDPYKKNPYIHLHVVNACIMSTKLNYYIDNKLREDSWMDKDGVILYRVKNIKDDAKGKEDRLLYQFLLNDIVWGLSGDIISELYYNMGYYSDITVKESNLEEVHYHIKKLLMSVYLLGGKFPELDGERGECFRNYMIYGNKSEKVHKIIYRGHSLFFMKKNVIQRTGSDGDACDGVRKKNNDTQEDPLQKENKDSTEKNIDS